MYINIGRNEPCPCGSGNKFKKCHGGVNAGITPRAAADEPLNINPRLTYDGKIGRMREDFCADFIKRKQEIFPEITKAQAEAVMLTGESITCGKGCWFCCTQYVDASIQESEAIVYYLSRNGKALQSFLQDYPEWRERVRDAGDSFEKIIHRWEKGPDGKWRDRKSVQGGLAAMYAYATANIPCPFLADGICSIYYVRPYNCAGCYATTPAELCQPLNRSKAKIHTSVPPRIVDDTAFYFENLAQPVQSLMPVTVHKILTRGLEAVRELTGLRELPEK